MTYGPMRGRRHMGGCTCRDCGSYDPPSRASEKREWEKGIGMELSAEEEAAAERYTNGPAATPSLEYVAELRERASNGELPIRHMSILNEGDLAAYYQERKDDPDEWGDTEDALVPSRRMDVAFRIRLSPDEFDIVVQAAAVTGMTVSGWIKHAAIEQSRQANNNSEGHTS